MYSLSYSESIEVAASPEALYLLVSDVTRTGEWSPTCTSCSWHDGGPQDGARFTGRNEENGRIWETVSTVVTAEPGSEFAWMVGKSFVRWGYTFTPADGGTRLTESWEFRPEGVSMFHEKYGADAERQIAARTVSAHRGIPVTLQAIKRIAESG